MIEPSLVACGLAGSPVDFVDRAGVLFISRKRRSSGFCDLALVPEIPRSRWLRSPLGNDSENKAVPRLD